MKSDIQIYVDSIRDDLKKLYEAEYTAEEIEELESNGEAYDVTSYVTDCLDVEYIVDSSGGYIGARIYVTLGGPTAWIDTRDGYVRGTWGTEYAESWIPYEIAEVIDDVYDEYWQMIKSGEEKQERM